MTKLYVIMCGGFQGLMYYKTRKEAEAAAIRREALTGMRWTVREVWG